MELLDLDSDKKVAYQLVGVDEADIKNGRLSVFSPLGRALIGKKKRDSVELQSPKGDKEYEVFNFKFE